MIPSLSVVAPYWLDRPATEALAIAAEAERLDIGEMWLGEMMTFDAATLGGAIAARTSRLTITLGPLAVGVHSPASLAMKLASVAAIGDRPARLALGASSQAVVERWHGRDWTRNAQRLLETAVGVRQAAEGRTSLSGELVRTSGFRLGIPVPSPHITFAAFGPQAVAAAADAADRVVINLITPAAAAEIRQALDGHGATETPLAAWVVAGTNRSEEVRQQVAGAVVRYLTAPGYTDMFGKAGFGDRVEDALAGLPLSELAAQVGWDLIDSIALFGDEAAMAAGIHRYVAAGVSEICVVPATADDPAGSRVLATLAGLL